jgi:hypothetical protein
MAKKQTKYMIINSTSRAQEQGIASQAIDEWVTPRSAGGAHARAAHGDLMCEIESGYKTCLSLPTDGTTPSVLDVSSLRYIYGDYGFRGYNRVLIIYTPYYTCSSCSVNEDVSRSSKPSTTLVVQPSIHSRDDK